jgi:hypothetical protein
VDQPGVRLELSASGGSVGAAAGTTNAVGEFTTTATLAEGQSLLTIEIKALDGPGGDLLAEETVTAQLLTDGTVTIDNFYAHIAPRAGGPNGESDDDDKEADNPNWSLSGTAAAAGATATVNARATAVQDGATWRYSGSGELDATASGTESGASVLIESHVGFTVSGGQVRYQVQQRITGTFPPGPFLGGCQAWVDGRVINNVFGSASGVMDEGEHGLGHDCGGGAYEPDGWPTIDADHTFSITIGPG